MIGLQVSAAVIILTMIVGFGIKTIRFLNKILD